MSVINTGFAINNTISLFPIEWDILKYFAQQKYSDGFSDINQKIDEIEDEEIWSLYLNLTKLTANIASIDEATSKYATKYNKLTPKWFDEITVKNSVSENIIYIESLSAAEFETNLVVLSDSLENKKPIFIKVKESSSYTWDPKTIATFNEMLTAMIKNKTLIFNNGLFSIVKFALNIDKANRTDLDWLFTFNLLRLINKPTLFEDYAVEYIEEKGISSPDFINLEPSENELKKYFPDFSVASSEKNESAIIKIKSDLSESIESIVPLLKQGFKTHNALSLDFTTTHHADWTSAGLLTALIKKTEISDRSLLLVNTKPLIKKLLIASGVPEKLFKNI